MQMQQINRMSEKMFSFVHSGSGESCNVTLHYLNNQTAQRLDIFITPFFTPRRYTKSIFPDDSIYLSFFAHSLSQMYQQIEEFFNLVEVSFQDPSQLIAVLKVRVKGLDFQEKVHIYFLEDSFNQSLREPPRQSLSIAGSKYKSHHSALHRADSLYCSLEVAEAASKCPINLQNLEGKGIKLYLDICFQHPPKRIKSKKRAQEFNDLSRPRKIPQQNCSQERDCRDSTVCCSEGKMMNSVDPCQRKCPEVSPCFQGLIKEQEPSRQSQSSSWRK